MANEPTALGEELLIIQKEFAGFSDTRERLDLLALDKSGNIVVIENKLDDSGRDVTWQALKYVSYCSSLSKEEITDIYQEYLDKEDNGKKAEEMLSEFYDNIEYSELLLNKGYEQRIILVASNFRKEVTSTVMWLINHNIRIECFKVTPYKLNEDNLLNIEQIIPVRDAEEYTIKMASKITSELKNEDKLVERHQIRLRFWRRLLDYFVTKSDTFNSINPTKDSWLGTGCGISSGAYNFVVSKNYARVELYFSRFEKDENKLIFDTILKYKEDIERNLGFELIWERLNDKKATRIKFQRDDFNVYDEDNWDEMIKFMTPIMMKFQTVFDKYINIAKKELE